MGAVFDFMLAPANLVFLLVLGGVLATVLTIVMPMLSGDKLNTRMKSVALEREKIRARERARLAGEKKNGRTKAVKKEPGAVIKGLVEKLNLRAALVDEATMKTLIQAGYRGQGPLFIFLALRVILPLVFFILTLLYLVFLSGMKLTFMQSLLGAIVGGGLGFYLPVLFVRNRQAARQLSVTRAWPDALDLTLICVESGMTIEVAFRRVASEIGSQSVALAEELMLTTAELSYLQERRQAYDNLVERTGLEAVKNVVLSLMQAEKYGTPLAQALRVLSQENRDQRMSMAEKKAAALPPKLTVPMMVCFLPVLFLVILGPAIINTKW